MNKSKIKLGGIFYPTSDINGGNIPFDSLFIPYIFKEIYLEGIYVDIFNQKKTWLSLTWEPRWEL